MNASNRQRSERAAVVRDDRDQRLDGAVVVAAGEVDQRDPGQLGRLGQGELDGGDRVMLIGGRGRVESVLVLRPVVPTPRDAPRATGGRLELG